MVHGNQRCQRSNALRHKGFHACQRSQRRVECFHTAGVTGSIPVSPTTYRPRNHCPTASSVAPSQAMTVSGRVSRRVAAEGYLRTPKSIRFTALSGITAMLSESGQKPT